MNRRSRPGHLDCGELMVKPARSERRSGFFREGDKEAADKERGKDTGEDEQAGKRAGLPVVTMDYSA
jgi:hypothetical protein